MPSATPRAERIIIRIATPTGKPLDLVVAGVEPPGQPADYAAIPRDARTAEIAGIMVACWLDRPKPLRAEFAAAVESAWDDALGGVGADLDPAEVGAELDPYQIAGDPVGEPPELPEAAAEFIEARDAFEGCLDDDECDPVARRLVASGREIVRRLLRDHRLPDPGIDPAAVSPVAAAIVGATLFGVMGDPERPDSRGQLVAIPLDALRRFPG